MVKSIHNLFLERVCKPRVSLGQSVPFEPSLIPKDVPGVVFRTGDDDIIIYFPKEAQEGKYCDIDPDYACTFAVTGKCKGYKESICGLGLSTRARNALLRNGLVNVDDVKNLNVSQIMSFKQIGRKLAEEIAIKTSVRDAFSSTEVER